MEYYEYIKWDNENAQRLNIPGISPVTINGEKTILFEAMRKKFITNNYIKALHDICFYWYGSYEILDTLIRHGIIKQREDYSMEWTLNKTSLAWLFKEGMVTMDYDDGYTYHIPGGFWNPVAILFGEKREILKKLIHNKMAYGGNSQDIERLKAILNENGIQL